MNQGENNADYLRDETPRARYAAHGTRRTTKTKLACGLARFPASKAAYGNDEVYFGNWFTPNCNPIVTTGIVSSAQFRIHCTVRGFGRLHPDHRGFNVHVAMDALNTKNNKIDRLFYVSWIAMGY